MSKRALLLCAMSLASGFLGCSEGAPPMAGNSNAASGQSPKVNGDAVTPPAASAPLVINTLEGFDTDLVHYSDQGSGFFPMIVVRALKDSKTGRPFLENLERFGLLPGEKSERNPDGLPVGITTNTVQFGDRKIEMFGFNCAACHTSDLHYQGKVVRVEGGAGLFYVDALGDAIGNSLEATLKNPKEFMAFLQRYLKLKRDAGSPLSQKLDLIVHLNSDGEFGNAVAEHVHNVVDRLRTDIENIKSGAPPQFKAEDLKALAASLARKATGDKSMIGSARSDEEKQQLVEALLQEFQGSIDDLRYRLAFLKVRKWLQQPGNRLDGGYGRADDFGTARVELFAGWNEKNRLAVNAPVSTPPLWNVDRYEWLHWNANSNSVVQRSIGEAIGVGATFDARTFDTSVNIVSQMLMEQQIQKLTAPQWPADVFGTPDEVLAKRGGELYQQHCAECHSPQGVNDKGLMVVKLFTLDEMKTDPLVATNFDRPVYKEDDSTIGFAEAIRILLAELQARAKAGMTPEYQKLMEDLEADRLPVKWRATLSETGGPVYPGRMLEGSWATAPYLHNGSVPTLYHLMLPAAERPAKFMVGSHEFDPKTVGFVWESEKTASTPVKALFEFDTSIEGNWNVGHEYGTDLPDEDRWAIVEYLKIHRDPPAPTNVISE